MWFSYIILSVTTEILQDGKMKRIVKSFDYFSCGVLSTFRSLLELLLGFVPTNTTQILQAHKQMECDNNEH